jgi:hypothetical protein
MPRLHDVPTRTTLTLDDDVAAGLRREVRRSGHPFRTVVNDSIRAGLAARAKRVPKPFELETFDLGLRPGLDLDDIEGLLDLIEGPNRR